MIDYSKWKQTTKAVTTLQLDARNPRLPPRTGTPTQLDLIAELIKHEDVYGAAKKVMQRGFYRHEIPIVVEEHGKLVVLEGNRRVAAVKLLISPSLAPEKERARFRKLGHKGSITSFRKIPVLIAPSRDAAAPAIQSKHTEPEVEPWSPVMQARFYADRIADGSTVAELSADYALPPGRIMEFLQNYQMYQVACNLDLPPEVAAKVNDPRDFPLTNLERIYRNAEAAQFLGISFDADRNIKGHVKLDEFKKAFRKVVTDVALGRANSRKLNSSEEFKKYLGEFGQDAPDLSKKGSFSAKDLIPHAAAKGHAMLKNVPQVAPKPMRPQTALVSKAFSCGIADPRINEILKNDLKKISVEDHPNAVALTLRAFVDLVVGDYCDRIGATAKIIERARTKEGKPADWYPSVRQMLKYVVNESATLSVHPLALKAAKMLIADDKLVNVLVLDAFAHNKYVIPTAAELRSFWTQIEEAMKAMLAKNPTAANGGS